MSATWNMKPKSGDGDWELPPAGNLLAVCVAMIDLGTQQETYLGKPREARQLAVVWELIGMQNSKTGAAHVVCSKFNASLHKKANLRKTLESWRGMPIRDDEEFDIFKVVGASCLLQVSHDTTASGNATYSIDAVTAVPRGMTKAAPTFPLIRYRIEDGQELMPTEEWLPMLYGKSIPDKIKECVEFQAAKKAVAQKEKEQEPVSQAVRDGAGMDPGDDCPF